MDSDAETILDEDEDSLVSSISSISTELFEEDDDGTDDGRENMEIAAPDLSRQSGPALMPNSGPSSVRLPSAGGSGHSPDSSNLSPSTVSSPGSIGLRGLFERLNRANEGARTVGGGGLRLPDRTVISQGPPSSSSTSGNPQNRAILSASFANTSSLSQPPAIQVANVHSLRAPLGSLAGIVPNLNPRAASRPIPPRDGGPDAVIGPRPPRSESATEELPSTTVNEGPVIATNSDQGRTPAAGGNPSVPIAGSAIIGVDVVGRRDSLGDFKLPAPESGKDDDGDAGSDDESQTCIICYEPWSNSGKHRLASLKCGHIFGQSCIQKWLKGQGGKCPQCNAKAKKSDIRVIYAKALKAIDTSERDKALKALEQEKELRRKIEIERAQMALKYQLAMEEVNRIKSQVKHQSSPTRSSQAGPSKLPGAPAPLPGSYVLEKTISVSTEGNSRVLAYDYANHALIASVPSPNQILFSGYGVKKISSLMEWKTSQYVPIHSKPIRGLGFNGRNDGLLLTGAMDKTLKITSLSSNTVVQTYSTCAPVWSCCWNQEDVNYLFAGLSNGTIVVFDTRNTSEEVLTLNREGSKHPIVAMNYVPSVQGSQSRCSGLLVGTLSNCSFWEQRSSLDFKPSILPLEGNCISLSFEPSTRHCLASFRPNKSCPSMRHVMCELLHVPKEGQTEPEFKCNPIQSFFGGSTVKLLARSAIFRRPNFKDHLLIAAGDEASSSLDLWDSSSGTKVQHLMAGATVLDVAPFRMNNVDYLGALSEKVVKLYKWQV